MALQRRVEAVVIRRRVALDGDNPVPAARGCGGQQVPPCDTEPARGG